MSSKYPHGFRSALDKSPESNVPRPGEDVSRWECPPEAQAPDPRPGFYYVSVMDGPRRALVRGPWTNHADALAAVETVRAEAEKADPRAVWYAFGTARCETDVGPGVLGGPLQKGG